MHYGCFFVFNLCDTYYSSDRFAPDLQLIYT